MKKTIFLSTLLTFFSFATHANDLGVGGVVEETPVSEGEIVYTAENCLGEQSPDSEELDISNCPELPNVPKGAAYSDTGVYVGLGMWELEKTADGQTYAIDSLNGFDPEAGVDEKNRECWAKGYYRLRQILQKPPAEYTRLREAGFQDSFYQYQVDKRKGETGYTEGKLRAFRDHLVKWTTQVKEDGSCRVPTFTRFKEFAAKQLERRGVTFNPPSESN